MSSLVDVAVPEMAVSVLTYKTETAICPGARVIVEVQKHLHTGFVIGSTQKELPPDVEVKPIEGIIDDSLMTDLGLGRVGWESLHVRSEYRSADDTTQKFLHRRKS